MFWCCKALKIWISYSTNYEFVLLFPFKNSSLSIFSAIFYLGSAKCSAKYTLAVLPLPSDFII